MKAPALVAVEQDPGAFELLFAKASARGVRVGWLDLGASVEPPSVLAAATESGVAKAVSASPGRIVSAKATKGEPVLRDLLREHFLGCSIVLVRGHGGRPSLRIEGDHANLEVAAARTRRLALDELLDELLRPRHRA